MPSTTKSSCTGTAGFCARVVQDREFKHSCKNNTNILRKSGIHVVNDKSHIHPEYFCETCRAKAKRFSVGKQVESSLHDYQWTEHADSGCAVCSLFRNQNKRERRSKLGKKRGRPCDKITNGILCNAPPSLKAATPLSLSRFLPPITVSLHDHQCGICGYIVDRPVQTPCGKEVCSVCISFPISKSDLTSFKCSSCNDFHSITESSYPKASAVVMKVLGDLLLACDVSTCTQVVALKNLKAHVDSGCKHALPTFSPSKLTVGQITSRPLTSPPIKAEQNAATNVVKRLLCSSSSEPGPSGLHTSAKLSTAGQVSNSHFTCILGWKKFMVIRIHIHNIKHKS